MGLRRTNLSTAVTKLLSRSSACDLTALPKCELQPLSQLAAMLGLGDNA